MHFFVYTFFKFVKNAQDNYAGHTYRSDKYVAGDDTVRLSVTLQMADAAACVDNSQHALTVGAKFGLALLFRALDITCTRSLTELSDVLLSPLWNSTVNTTAGSAIQY